MTVGTVIPTVTSLMANLDAKLPVAVSIMLHNVGDADQGLLNVDVWGYGNAHRAPLSRISSFNLRVASGYEQVGGMLRYGNVVKPEVDVEGDCKLWLDTCIGHHGAECARPGWSAQLAPPSGRDFRLIDVNALRVVVAAGEVPRYAALSYVWGATGKHALNLHKRNAASLGASLLGQDRPVARTIMDAIAVTRRLGLSYLWADSLCIVQKSEFDPSDDDAAAREAQISQMHSIYGNAELTLVAASGGDAESGLLSPREIMPETQIACTVLPGPSPTPSPTSAPTSTPPVGFNPSSQSINILAPIAYPATYSTWDTRAWTLQEKLLSKRLLVFSPGGFVTFHCRRGTLREDMPASHAGAAAGPPKIPWLELPERGSIAYLPSARKEWDGTLQIQRAAFFEEYAKLVGQYSSREMTDSRDSLNAVAGLLRVLESMAVPPSLSGVGQGEELGLGRTLHGLPERFLELALLWQPPAVEGAYLTRKPHRMLPSWSWIGWEVGMDATAAERGSAAKPGVRFDELFWVGVNDDLSLRKVVGVADEESAGGFSVRKALSRAQQLAAARLSGECASPATKDKERPLDERLRPVVMWFRSTAPPSSPALASNGCGYGHGRPTSATHSLVLVNGNGLGLAFGDADRDAVSEFIQAAAELRGHVTSPPRIPIDVPLDSRHLVCETQVTTFRLRKGPPRREKLWKRSAKGFVGDRELVMAQVEVIDTSGRVVGTVFPTDARKGCSSEPYHLILLSEAQYCGDEKRVDVSGMPLYNVMVVEWDIRGEFATRLGLGKVGKRAWWEARPELKTVILE